MESVYPLNGKRTKPPFIIDIAKFLLLIGTTIIFVYFLPSPLYSKIAFLLYLPIIFYSKQDFLWLAWFFIIVDAPGLLFKGGLADDPNRLPIYTIAAGASISFIELVIFVFLLKVLIKMKHYPRIIFIKQFQIFLVLVAFYIIVTITFLDFDIIEVFRVVFPWSLVYVLSLLLNNENAFNRFNNIVFFVVFIVVATQIFSFISGEHLVNLLKPEAYHIKSHLSREVSELSTTASRSLYSMFLIFYTTIFSIVNIFKRDQIFRKEYLYLVLTFSFIACVLSGTRGYLLAISFIIGVSLFLKMKSLKQLFNTSLLIIILLIIIFLLQSLSPVVSRQLNLVSERFESMLFLIEGDLTAGGTLDRLTERVPRIMAIIDKSPIFGFGFSSVYFENADSDVGFFTNILNIGFLGVTLLYMLFINLLKTILLHTRTYFFIIKYGRIGTLFIIGFIGLQIFHFTTNIAFGLAPGANAAIYERYMIYGLVLAAINTFVVNLNPKRT